MEASPGEPILVSLAAPFNVIHDPPSDNKVADACIKLHCGQAVGAIGVHVDDLWHWLEECEDKEKGDRARWMTVLEIVWTTFTDGEIPAALMLSLLVIIPKPDSSERGIGLLESMWKLIKKIINHHLVQAIECDEALHGSQKKRGCGTAVSNVDWNRKEHCARGKPSSKSFFT